MHAFELCRFLCSVTLSTAFAAAPDADEPATHEAADTDIAASEPDEEFHDPKSGAGRQPVSSRAGQRAEGGGWGFEFHGYFMAPMRIGVGKREDPADGQSTTTFHAPVVPDDQYLTWQHTTHNPRSWTEMYFSYGNPVAKGTVAIEAFNFTDAAWNNTQAQFGIAQGFVTLTPRFKRSRVKLEWRVGAFDRRYGMMGKYDPGAYETYLFGRTRAMGEVLALAIPVRNFSILLEHGVGAARPDPSVWNTSRFTLLNHAHVGAAYKDMAELGFHWMGARAQEEDRDGEVENPDAPDGSVNVLGPDFRFDGGRFGYWYTGFSYIKLEHARVVGPALEVIHSQGGGNYTLGLVDNYLEGPTMSSDGNGEIYSFALQTDHSLRKMMAGGEGFWGEGWDVRLSLYTMINKVRSQDPDADGVLKVKYGADLLYSALPWLGIGAKFDRLQPNNAIPEQSFAILSPRVIFRSNWVTHETISIQYSRYFFNKRVCDTGASQVQCVQPPVAPSIPDGFGTTLEDLPTETRGAPTMIPDLNVFTISASIWW